MKEMRVISMWQPWASWVAWGFKPIETRTHSRFQRLQGERIGIHAAKFYDGKALQLARPYLTAEQLTRTLTSPLPKGAILCTAMVVLHARLKPEHAPAALIECETPRFGLFLTEIEVLEHPMLMRGHQGVWKVKL